jgi:hypothetical protein
MSILGHAKSFLANYKPAEPKGPLAMNDFIKQERVAMATPQASTSDQPSPKPVLGPEDYDPKKPEESLRKIKDCQKAYGGKPVRQCNPLRD